MLSLSDFRDVEISMKLVEDLTKQASHIQQQVLEEILTQNAETEYLSGFLGDNVNKETFKKNVPVVDYRDIKPYIERIANGDKSKILSSKSISELLASSGTSGGEWKMFPTTDEEFDRKTLFDNLFVPVISQYVNGLDQGKGMYLCFTRADLSSPYGITLRPAITSYFMSSNFKNIFSSKLNIHTSPYETILCTDGKQSMYCQLLCGLIQRDVVLRIGTTFGYAFLQAIKFLEEYWKELCSNIRTGRVSDWIMDPSCRNAVMSILGEGNSKLADHIEFECSQRSWEGIVKRLWHRTKYIETIITGSMAQYVSTLEFYAGDIPLVSPKYACSECYLGINLNPLCKPSDVSYTLLPCMGYFEFIPVERNHEEASNGVSNIDEEEKVVDLVDVKLGHDYELVVTTFAGLYRYRIGDILRVTGFYNNAPQFRFVRRRDALLSIHSDKTNEEDLLNAVTQATLFLETHGYLLTGYTSCTDISSIPGHYVLFWELGTKRDGNMHVIENEVIEQCCNIMEEALGYVYRTCRTKDKTIGALEIRVVKYGTFKALMDFSVSRGASMSQYKTPICIKSVEGVGILNQRVVGRFFSRKDPSWKPFSINGR